MHAEPAGVSFRYRGRHYTGQLVLRRDSLTPASDYGFMLKNERGATASQGSAQGDRCEVTAIILAALKAHPEILAAADRADLARRLILTSSEAPSLFPLPVVAETRAVGEIEHRRASAVPPACGGGFIGVAHPLAHGRHD